MPDAIDALLAQNAEARGDLMDAIDALPPDRRCEGWYGEEQWSVHDIVAHLIGWQDGWAHALELMAKGERPSIPGYEGDDDPYNASSVGSRREHSWEQLMGELRSTRERHEAAVRNLRGNLDPERLAPGKTAHNLANAGGHDHEHIEAIIEWRREQGLLR
ncbi:MAG: ClbS/DfsB family four-helix bundle protein [Dehalococcoidia bacterium]|nr:ClbS/DfsB family four-helix bundle protein [Dehalococcoidia bacterium]